ncbi:MAG TPA: ATP-binding protein [Thermodesulfobacteriota bacterium]|nr:ATP-binding protein [Thermodesulfobacteriota bacterium]
MINSLTLPNLAIVITSVILGIFVLLKDKNVLINRLWFFLSLCIGIWSFGFLKTITSANEETALFWGRFLYIGAIFIPTVFLHFIFSVLNDLENRKKILIIAYSLCVLFLIFDFTPWFIKDVTPMPPFKYYDVPGTIYPFWVLSILVQIIYAHYRLIKALKNLIGVKRNQIKYLLAASLIAFTGGVSGILPVFGIIIPPDGNYLIALYPVIISYSIVQHRLMDITIVLKKGTIHTLLLTLIFIPSFAIVVFFEKLILGSINIPLTLIISLLFILGIFLSPRVKPQVEEVVDRVIFKEKYRYQKTLSDLSRVMVSILDLKLLSQKIIDTLTQEIEIEGASLFIMDEEKGYYYPIVCTGSGCDEIKKIFLRKEEPFCVWVKKKNDIIIKEELRGNEKIYLERLEKMQAEATIPLLWKNELVGILNLSHKISRDMYNREDLDLLKTLANQATIAIENAKMYDALKKTKSRMQRADRLASLGTLTAGLAHEIRNPLVAVKTFLQLLPEKYDDDEFRNYFLSVASGEVDRISSLVTELLDFARPSEPQLREENINEILDKMVTLVTTETKKKNLKITRNLGEHLPFIQVDKDQIKQVFLNILLNAVQATPENGEITIVTRSFAKSPGETFLQIEVKDTGPGIPAQELELIFTPFYTTKTQGSGLGLSITHQIVEEHHGYIEVDSQVGSGTSFTINLPLNADSLTEKRQKATVQ